MGLSGRYLVQKEELAMRNPPGQKWSAGTLWAAGAVRAAALRGGARRRAACWPQEGAAAYEI